eukprot:6056419-Pleurochrysis_carterae.AAC.3
MLHIAIARMPFKACSQHARRLSFAPCTLRVKCHSEWLKSATGRKQETTGGARSSQYGWATMRSRANAEARGAREMECGIGDSKVGSRNVEAGECRREGKKRQERKKRRAKNNGNRLRWQGSRCSLGGRQISEARQTRRRWEAESQVGRRVLESASDAPFRI